MDTSKRNFREPIFMGNGDSSMGQAYKLIKRLEEGIGTHGGLQQGQGHITKSEMNEGKKSIKCVVADIATALNVDITFKSELMELTRKKWYDPLYDADDMKSDYDGWGWQLNIGNANIGWLPAHKNGKFEISVNTTTNNEYDSNKEYTLEEAMEIIRTILKQ